MGSRLITAVLALLIAHTAVASPQDLDRWREWILQRHPDHACPYIARTDGMRRCAWPGQLRITVDASHANFAQHWEVRGESWLRLPGGRGQWPQDVTVNGQAATVLARDGHPSLHAEAGSYTIKGVIHWQRVPQHLLIPRDSGLIELTLHGRDVPGPELREDRILLQGDRQGSDAAQKENTARIDIYRKLVDGVPLMLFTEARLAIAGKPREILTGQLLPEGTEIVDLSSPLPARIESDGRVRVQARPGEWVLRLAARYDPASTAFRFTRLDDQWPDQEIWVFEPAPRFRGLTLSGAAAVDPTQLRLPDGWQNLPTWLLTPETTLELNESWRGDETPSANTLALRRTLWLDFDGRGATVKDMITGTMNQGWRLEAAPALQLGRVSVNGEPQLVTRLGAPRGAGVEIRQRDLRIDALGRLDSATESPATGWDAGFREVSATLNLPPGWRLWHAAGPDSVGASWLSQWDLWDLFICLLIIGSSFRLIGASAALLALLSLALSYHVDGSPVWGWLLVLACIPLLRALPGDRSRRLLRIVTHAFLAAVTIAAVAFSVQQIRSALYPQLEYAGQIHAVAARDYAAPAHEAVEVSDAFVESAPPPGGAAAKSEAARGVGYAEIARRYQPAANVQTGPGEPRWHWRTVQLSWNGPVLAEDALSLWLSPPWLSRLLNVVEVALIWAYLLILIRTVRAPRSVPGNPPATSAAVAVLGAALLSGLLSVVPGPAVAADYPPRHLLNELEGRLTEPAECLPDCAAIHQASVALADDSLTLRLRVSAGTAIGFPLPLGAGWEPREVVVDGSASTALARSEDALEVALEPGNHSLVLVGKVTADTVRLPFRLSPHNIAVNAPRWDVSGLVDGQLPGLTLELQKQEKQGAAETLLPEPVEPFIRIERRITLDVDWSVATTVHRIAPGRGAISVRAPLLDGESVVTPGVAVEGGAVIATIAANADAISWRSVIEPSASIELTAAQAHRSVETWAIEPSPRWHISTSGLNPLKSASGESSWVSTWWPWPGESLSVSALRPEAVEGPTTTVERARLELNPGARSSVAGLALEVRSSLGGDYPIELLEPGELRRIVLDGAEQVLPKKGEVLSVMLHPGLQSVELEWELPRGIGLMTSTPRVRLATPAANIDIVVRVPLSRWVLTVHGPDIGPAMLYWGILVVIVGIAIALAAVIRRLGLGIPMKTRHWLLLAIGMSTVNIAGSVIVVLWFFLLEARSRAHMPQRRWLYNLVQLGLIAATVLAMISLFYAIPQSLLWLPNMQITGNGSSNYLLQWYQDQSSEMLPQAGTFSVPLFIYRLAMLAWSLWLVFALLRWIRWGWGCFSHGGLWRPRVRITPP